MQNKLSQFVKRQLVIIIFLLIISIFPALTGNINYKKDEINPNNVIEDSPGLLHSATTITDFKYYKEITIDSSKVIGSGDLTNFTLLFSIDDTDLRTEVQDDGDDIAFYDGTNWLDYELELFKQDLNFSGKNNKSWEY